MDKKVKPYTQQEEPTTPIVSEPAVEYQRMPNIQLEADKARLIRAIVNIDSRTLFDKVKQQLYGILNIKEDTAINEPDSKEYIMSGLKEAFRELKEIKAGKGKTYSVEEVLKEMREETDSND